MKLFSSLYQGTLRGRSDEILVFTNLLAYADQHGIVDKHFKAVADETGLTLDRVEAAIAQLELPDPESRSPEMDGCRIVKMDEHRLWGWKIVNYGKYRAIRSEEDRREQNRLAQEKWRRKQNKPPSANDKQRKPPSAQAEAEAEAEAEAKIKGSSAAQSAAPPLNGKGSILSLKELPDEWRVWCAGHRTDLDPQAVWVKFHDHWEANANQRTAKKHDWFAAWRNWVRSERRDKNAPPDYSEVFNKKD